MAELRREAPGAAARQYMERLEEELRRGKAVDVEREAKQKEMDVDGLDCGVLERKEDVERMWGRGTEGLVDLGQITGVLARLERAEKAVSVVDGT